MHERSLYIFFRKKLSIQILYPFKKCWLSSLLSYKCSLYILATNPLLVLCFIGISPRSMGVLLFLMSVSSSYGLRGGLLPYC